MHDYLNSKAIVKFFLPSELTYFNLWDQLCGLFFSNFSPLHCACLIWFTYVLDARFYPFEGRTYEDKDDFIPSIDKYLLLWVLGGILFLPTAIEAVLNLDSIRALITDLSSLLTTYYNSLYDTLSSIATSITTLTTLVTTQYNDLVTRLTTITTTLTTISSTLTTISTSITTISTQLTDIIALITALGK